MKKALVIGGNGKVGGYLCPLLLQAGYQVKSVSRSGKLPPAPQDGYEQVEAIRLDRGQEGFEAQIAALQNAYAMQQTQQAAQGAAEGTQ